MGFGDILMAAGLAETLHAQAPARGPVCIVDTDGAPRWQPLWDGNPALTSRRRPETPVVVCGKGALPYIDYAQWIKGERYAYSPTYRARDHRAHVYLTEAERFYGVAARDSFGPYLLLEPSPTDRKNPNRSWPLAAWQAVVDGLRARLGQRLALVQCVHEAWAPLNDTSTITTPTFRDACGVYLGARLVVCLEGGVAFATAALGVPTVVLWGGCVNADVLGYPEQVNLVDDDPQTPCGAQLPCDHCAAAWARLTPARVIDACLAALAPAREGAA